MGLVQAFRERRWGAAVVVTVVLGPLLGFLYLGRGRLAIVYGILEAVCVVAAFVVAVIFNLIGPDPGAALGGSVYVAIAPIRLVAAVHAARLARAMAADEIRPWFARRAALLAVLAVLIVWPRLAAIMVRAIWMEPMDMKSAAMAPAIAQGDHVFVDKRFYLSAEPALGDIVVVRDGDGVSYIRRIAALRDGLFTVSAQGEGDRPMTVPRSAIVGKVTIVFWSARTKSWQWERPG